MKALLAILAVYNIGVAGYSQTNTNAPLSLTWKYHLPISGSYRPEPSVGFFAGEVIEIKSNKFHYTQFTDDLGFRVPDCEGQIFQFSDHVFFDHRKIPSPDRVSGLLNNHPVLWTYEAFHNWKKTGEIDPMGILFWRQPEIKRDAVTNRSEMIRQLRSAMRTN